MAFPCNQFAGQEPGNSEDIVCFMGERKVKFDMFEKIDVNGDSAHPLWKFLKASYILSEDKLYKCYSLMLLIKNKFKSEDNIYLLSQFHY